MMHPYLAKESYTYLVSSLYIMAFVTRSGGRILHAQTYPLQEVDAEEGDGRLIRTIRYIRVGRYNQGGVILQRLRYMYMYMLLHDN